MPDYTIKIKDQDRFTAMVKHEDEREINKVLIFVRKDAISDDIKAISAEYKDRLRFYVIIIPKKKSKA